MPTDEQFNARGLMRPRLRPRPDASYMNGTGLVAPQVTAQVPSVAPRPMSSAGYGSQNAPGREESFSTAPTDTAPTPDELKQLQQNRWRRVLQQETAIRQARMAGAQSGRMDYGTIHEMENELKLARSSHNELNSILSRRTTDQNEGEFNASQESLRNTAEMNRMKQYPADFIGPTMEGHRAFFLGDLKPYNDPSNVAARAGRVAEKDTVLNSPDTQRELADLRRNMMRNQLAKRAVDAGDLTAVTEAEAGPKIAAARAKAAIAQSEGEATRATADAGTTKFNTELERSMRRQQVKKVQESQAYEVSGVDPTEYRTNALSFVDRLNKSFPDMDAETGAAFQQEFEDEVLGPLARLAEQNPGLAAKHAREIRNRMERPWKYGTFGKIGQATKRVFGQPTREERQGEFDSLKSQLDQYADLDKE